LDIPFFNLAVFVKFFASILLFLFARTARIHGAESPEPSDSTIAAEVSSKIDAELTSSDLDQRMRNLENRVSCISEKNVYGKWQGKSQSASVDGGFFFDASFLYWQAEITAGLEYVQSVNIHMPDPSLSQSQVDLADKRLDYKWEPGFRVGLGYIIEERQQWDLSLVWTRLHSHATSSIAISDLDVQQLKPNWLPFILGSSAQNASANWKLKFNTLDLISGRHFFLGRWFSLHPQAAIIGAWIHQKYRADYLGIQEYDAAGQDGFISDNTHFIASNQFTGFGIKMGSGVEWHLCPSWSILGNFFGTLSYGQFKTRQTFDGFFLVDLGGSIPGPFFELLQLNRKFWAVVPNFETEIGMKWAYFFCRDRYLISLAGFYDLSYWFYQNQLVNESFAKDTTFISDDLQRLIFINNTMVQELKTQGNLAIQGIRVQLSLDF
jgi:hypothetical protein